MARILVVLLVGLAWQFAAVLPLLAESPAVSPQSLAVLVASAAEKRGLESEAGDESTAARKAEAQLTRNEQRLARLKKPLTEIRVTAETADTQSPEGGASDLLKSQTEFVISSSGLSPVTPDRYSISSYHRPLYFEELNLERCGETYGCATNLISGIHFLTNTVALPYRLATQRADCPVKSHGDCQSCQSYSHDIEPFGFEAKGTLVEAAVIAGFIFLAM